MSERVTPEKSTANGNGGQTSENRAPEPTTGQSPLAPTTGGSITRSSETRQSSGARRRPLCVRCCKKKDWAMDKYLKEINPWERTAEQVSSMLGAKFADWPEPRIAVSGSLCAGCIVEERIERQERKNMEFADDE